MLAAYSPSVAETPDGIAGVGTVMVPDTSLNVSPVGGSEMTAPDQLVLYWTVLFPDEALALDFELTDSRAIMADPWCSLAPAARLCMRWVNRGDGAASVDVARTTERMQDENFILDEVNERPKSERKCNDKKIYQKNRSEE